MSQARTAPRERAGRGAVVGRAVGARLRALRTPHIRVLVAAAVAAVVAAGVIVTVALRPDGEGGPRVPDTRARHYTEVDACLLTDGKGITGGTAAEVWQGMQDASSKTHARVSYAQVIGEQNTGNARPFLNGLLQRSCDVVLAVGRPEAAVAAQAAPVHRDVGFVLVGDTAAAGTNVTAVRVGAGLRADVGGAVERAVEARG
ncbi:hypothetical protein [Streptomyces sp. NPDC001068]|uniref:hypothetical protein n=1 Tax=Streptomyces sp. NPDC001068 TaxID=3364544 RepID=UPI0036C02986